MRLRSGRRSSSGRCGGAVATASDPDRVLSEFLHTTYAATADLAHWDRAALEADPHRLEHH